MSDALLYLIDDETGCWEWQRYVEPGGYGRWVRDGEQLAHRVMYKQLKGPIPEDRQIDHLCRNRACVNPAHLELVTPLENCLRGESTHLAEEVVRAIRRADGTDRELAKRFNVARSHVFRIRTGEAWFHLGLGPGERLIDPGPPLGARTHCPHGHPYDEQNTAIRNGRRNCRTCERERARKRRAQRTEAA